MGLHSTFRNEFWLWRGQADDRWPLHPSMHSRVLLTPGHPHDNAQLSNDTVNWATSQLIALARQNQLDIVEDLRLPDLALLAHLQHHGAATPLLDVASDPLVGLWMTAHASGPDFRCHDDKDGWLFAIRRPPKDRWILPLDSRPYLDSAAGACDIASLLEGKGVFWYRPPAISERLRIQRGSFLLGSMTTDPSCTLPLVISSDHPWIATRIAHLGDPGKPVPAKTDVVAFRVRQGIKSEIRSWLEDRAGLTQETIYPIPWHRPFLEDFCRSYDRGRPLDLGSSATAGHASLAPARAASPRSGVRESRRSRDVMPPGAAH